MSDEELLKAIVQAAREERAARDPNLERVTLGEATDDELRALEARAEDDAAFASALARHRPLSDDAHARFADAILGASKEEATAKGAIAKEEPNAKEAIAKEEPAAKEEPNAKEEAIAKDPPDAETKRGVLVRLFPVLAPLAVAAAVLLFFVFRSGDALPAYDVTLRAAADTRLAPAPGPASPTEPVRLHPSSTLEMVIRPAAKVDGAVAVRAVVVRNGRAAAWNPAVEIGDGGAVRIRERVDTVVPEKSGVWELVVAVGRPSALPSSADLAHRAVNPDSSDAPKATRIVRAKIEIVPGP